MSHQPPATIETSTMIGAELADEVRALLARILPLDLRDDRLDTWPGRNDGPQPEPSDAAGDGPKREQPFALARTEGRLVAFLGGPTEQDRAELDLLVDPDVAGPVTLAASLVDAIGPTVAADGAETVRLWARPRLDWHQDLVELLAASPSRALHQMRAPLPVATTPIASRAYRPHDDLDAVRLVNNRAFASHPDQGNQSEEQLLATMAEPWFEADGLRIHERDGRVIGFCWTKVHPARVDRAQPGASSTALGEIFVIAVDPDFHGQGIGGPMTAAGLAWLLDQGLTTGMLYVEADNIPAVRTYERLGFTIVRTDAAWTLQASP